jgi:hypothetical protein
MVAFVAVVVAAVDIAVTTSIGESFLLPPASEVSR